MRGYFHAMQNDDQKFIKTYLKFLNVLNQIPVESPRRVEPFQAKFGKYSIYLCISIDPFGRAKRRRSVTTTCKRASFSTSFALISLSAQTHNIRVLQRSIITLINPLWKQCKPLTNEIKRDVLWKLESMSKILAQFLLQVIKIWVREKIN